MKEIFGTKKRSLFFRNTVSAFVIIAMVSGVVIPVYAARFSTVQEARQAAWDDLYVNMEVSDSEENAVIKVNGAVAENGIAKVYVSDWSKVGILSKKSKTEAVMTQPEGKIQCGTIYSHTIFRIMDSDGDWLHIVSGKLAGYIPKRNVLTGSKVKRRADEVCPEQVISDNSESDNPITLSENGGVVVENMEQRKLYAIAKTMDGSYQIRVDAETKGYVKKTAVSTVREIQLASFEDETKSQEKAYTRYELNSMERLQLAAIIYCESQGESFLGQIAVGNVVMNRVKSSAFPDTIQKVIEEKGQFEPVTRGIFQSVLQTKKIKQSCFEAADAVIQGKKEITDQLFFSTDQSGLQIGNHWFR